CHNSLTTEVKVFTFFHIRLKRKTEPTLVSHVHEQSIIIFKLHFYVTSKETNALPCGNIIGTNALTKFHDNRAINVT
ncbi:hypothetical protein DPMN_145069, partial [Dreissena polymorpha]